MKRANWVLLIAMILVISMLAAPVSAATVGGSGHSTNGLIGSIIGIIKDIIIEIIDDWFDIPGVGDPDPTEPPVPTTPEEPTAPSEPVATDPTEPEVTEPEETEPEVTEPVETEPAVETVLELIEDQHTVENGYLLRGTTYTLSQIVAQQPQTAPYALRSSPVSTLADEGTTGGGNSEFIETEKEVFTNWVDGGQYYIQSAATVKAGGAGWVKVNMNNGVPASLTQGAQSEATAWTVTFNKDGTYALSVSVDGTDYYLSISSSGISFSATAVALQIENFSPTRNPSAVNDDGNLMRIGSNGYYLNRTSNTTFTTYNIAAGANNSLWLYQVVDGEVKQVQTEMVTETIKVVYFPVTMFNYDTDKLNVATINKELETPPKIIFSRAFTSAAVRLPAMSRMSVPPRLPPIPLPISWSPRPSTETAISTTWKPIPMTSTFW